MRLAALVSGGKDGMFAAHVARTRGHEIACLVTAEPSSEESMLCHYPNTRHVRLQAESMGVPAVLAPAADGGESGALEASLQKARDDHSVEGVVHGGIRSAYQRDAFAEIGARTGLDVLAPLWGSGDAEHMGALLDARFRFIIVAVSADGLDASWLGREVTRESVSELVRLGRRFGFAPSFEGGEAETFVLDCPMFSRPVGVFRARSEWDGYRGRFEIEEAGLVGRA